MRNRFPYSISLLAFSALLIHCQKVGPLEKQLGQAEARTREMLSRPVGEARTSGLLGILKETSPLLTEKTFVDATDVARRDALQFRASLLLAGILAHFAAEESDPAMQTARLEASRQLFMNAFLIDAGRSLNELKPWLPAKADTSLYEKVRIPTYGVLNETPEKDRLQTVLQVSEPLEYYLLQMVVADRLRKVRARQTTLAMLHADISHNGLPVATGDWDAESDRVLLKLK